MKKKFSKFELILVMLMELKVMNVNKVKQDHHFLNELIEDRNEIVLENFHYYDHYTITKKKININQVVKNLRN